MQPREGGAFGAPTAVSPPSPATPVRLVEGEVLAAAIRAATPTGGAVGSPEAEARLAALEGLAGSDLWRVPPVADGAVLERLDGLATDAPNARRAVAVVRHAAALSCATGTPLRVPPLVLMGPPGSGKTRVALALAGALGVPVEVVAGAGLSDPGPVVGYGVAWRGAGPGRLARLLLASPTLGVAMVVDEADKAVDGYAGAATLDSLLPLLEATTASTFEDSYLGVPMRADGAVWILTANGLDGLSAPLLDRCVVVEVPSLDGRERAAAVSRVVAEEGTRCGLGEAQLSPDAAVLLSQVPPRRARLAVRLAWGAALGVGRRRAERDDVEAALRLSRSDHDGGWRIGFTASPSDR